MHQRDRYRVHPHRFRLTFEFYWRLSHSISIPTKFVQRTIDLSDRFLNTGCSMIRRRLINSVKSFNIIYVIAVRINSIQVWRVVSIISNFDQWETWVNKYVRDFKSLSIVSSKYIHLVG
jgi:hypothetical protein